MTKQEAVNILSDGHSVISPKVAREVCKTLNIPFGRGLIHRWKSDPPGTFKGLTMRKGQENSEGVNTLSLSNYVADQLGVSEQAGSFIGRGFQAQANAGAIAKKVLVEESMESMPINLNNPDPRVQAFLRKVIK